MLTVAVQFLTGRYVATAIHHRDAAEWPPHPARLYSALVATWADADSPDDEERAALEWLERLPPPRIHASPADERRVRTHFVPTNDASVLGLSLQEGRYRRLQEHLAGVDDALVGAGGDLTATKVTRALARVDKQRDVDAQVSQVGRTSEDSAVTLLPENRGRQPRTFPSMTPHHDTVQYCWPDADADSDRFAALDRLLGRVVRLGHSSSFVSCRLAEAPAGEARYVPDALGELDLRHAGPGQLRALEAAYVQHRASKPRTLPHRAARYAERTGRSKVVKPSPHSSWLGGELIVLRRTGGRRLPIVAAVGAARALRGALMAHAQEPICEELTGHVVAGSGERTSPSSRPHAAFLALPFTGSKHARGQLLGVAVLLPRDIQQRPREEILRAMGRWEQSCDRGALPLHLGRAGKMEITRQIGRPDAWNLQRDTWAGPSTGWATATPIALDRHPGNLWGGRPEQVQDAFDRAQESIVMACRNVGLPDPMQVDVSLQPVVVGSRPATAFPVFTQGRGSRAVRRALVHARLHFPAEVVGPLVLGAGRYLGLGLLRPLDPARAGG